MRIVSGVAMRVLIDSGNYFADNLNLGDCAIFKVVAGRLTGLSEGGNRVVLRWLTRQPELMRDLCGDAVKPITDRELHSATAFPLEPESPFRPGSNDRPGVSRWVGGWRERRLRSRARTWARTRWSGDPRLPEQAGSRRARFLRYLDRADLVFATGGGFFSDAFARHAEGVLDTLAGGIAFGRPTVMASAGFERVRDQRLLAKAAAVLPRLDLIGCREGRTGPAWLRELGVPPERIVVTGDDAVELASAHRPSQLGDALGVNLRQADYAGVGEGVPLALGRVLRREMRNRGAAVLPVPISVFGPADLDPIGRLMGVETWDEETRARLGGLEGLLDQVARCRVVVTGSYHAAVFALSMGVPAVGLVGSDHYRTKISGLVHQFGGIGLPVIEASDPNLEDRLGEAIGRLWETADALRPRLIEFADAQVAEGRRFYEAVGRLAGRG